MHADRILVFARRPEPGRVKTRLTPTLTPEDAAGVYEACIHDVLVLAAHERAALELWYEDTAGAAEYFTRAFGHLRRRPQPAGDLGRKLRRALALSFAEDAVRVIVIGTDSPTLPEGTLTAAFRALDDAYGVIGPSRDGGYYLIGVHRDAWPAANALFRDIPWSTDRVFSTTLERARDAGVELRTLPGWYDIDRPADLRTARADAEPDSHLGRWLAAHGVPDPDG